MNRRRPACGVATRRASGLRLVAPRRTRSDDDPTRAPPPRGARAVCSPPGATTARRSSRRSLATSSRESMPRRRRLLRATTIGGWRRRRSAAALRRPPPPAWSPRGARRRRRAPRPWRASGGLRAPSRSSGSADERGGHGTGDARWRSVGLLRRHTPDDDALPARRHSGLGTRGSGFGVSTGPLMKRRSGQRSG